MKKVLFLLVMALLISCVKTTESNPIFTKGQVISKEHKDSETKVTYHYGYSMMKGKYCMHWGPEDFPEKNEVTFTFFNDTLTWNDKTLYDSTQATVDILYVKVYEDSVFTHNRIISVK